MCPTKRKRLLTKRSPFPSAKGNRFHVKRFRVKRFHVKRQFRANRHKMGRSSKIIERPFPASRDLSPVVTIRATDDGAP